ncbi:hypothetical protein cand_034500 [Cryptosporidium andersoni]|uniref:Uncharacterized protein n=1 Tax=Cryptosporidium andersoni TaxID=117008 RepID=A0A1J4MVC7_9CRYT|nr:hypothetical protein cand_034500 [Cryptosporidium andersoni]
MDFNFNDAPNEFDMQFLDASEVLEVDLTKDKNNTTELSNSKRLELKLTKKKRSKQKVKVNGRNKLKSKVISVDNDTILSSDSDGFIVPDDAPIPPDWEYNFALPITKHDTAFYRKVDNLIDMNSNDNNTRDKNVYLYSSEEEIDDPEGIKKILRREGKKKKKRNCNLKLEYSDGNGLSSLLNLYERNINKENFENENTNTPFEIVHNLVAGDDTPIFCNDSDENSNLDDNYLLPPEYLEFNSKNSRIFENMDNQVGTNQLADNDLEDDSINNLDDELDLVLSRNLSTLDDWFLWDNLVANYIDNLMKCMDIYDIVNLKCLNINIHTEFKELYSIRSWDLLIEALEMNLFLVLNKENSNETYKKEDEFQDNSLFSRIFYYMKYLFEKLSTDYQVEVKNNNLAELQRNHIKVLNISKEIFDSLKHNSVNNEKKLCLLILIIRIIIRIERNILNLLSESINFDNIKSNNSNGTKIKFSKPLRQLIKDIFYYFIDEFISDKIENPDVFYFKFQVIIFLNILIYKTNISNWILNIQNSLQFFEKMLIFRIFLHQYFDLEASNLESISDILPLKFISISLEKEIKSSVTIRKMIIFGNILRYTSLYIGQSSELSLWLNWIENSGLISYLAPKNFDYSNSILWCIQIWLFRDQLYHQSILEIIHFNFYLDDYFTKLISTKESGISVLSTISNFLDIDVELKSSYIKFDQLLLKIDKLRFSPLLAIISELYLHMYSILLFSTLKGIDDNRDNLNNQQQLEKNWTLLQTFSQRYLLRKFEENNDLSIYLTMFMTRFLLTTILENVLYYISENTMKINQKHCNSTIITFYLKKMVNLSEIYTENSDSIVNMLISEAVVSQNEEDTARFHEGTVFIRQLNILKQIRYLKFYTKPFLYESGGTYDIARNIVNIIIETLDDLIHNFYQICDIINLQYLGSDCNQAINEQITINIRIYTLKMFLLKNTLFSNFENISKILQNLFEYSTSLENFTLSRTEENCIICSKSTDFKHNLKISPNSKSISLSFILKVTEFINKVILKFIKSLYLMMSTSLNIYSKISKTNNTESRSSCKHKKCINHFNKNFQLLDLEESEDGFTGILVSINSTFVALILTLCANSDEKAKFIYNMSYLSVYLCEINYISQKIEQIKHGHSKISVNIYLILLSSLEHLTSKLNIREDKVALKPISLLLLLKFLYILGAIDVIKLNPYKLYSFTKSISVKLGIYEENMYPYYENNVNPTILFEKLKSDFVEMVLKYYSSILSRDTLSLSNSCWNESLTKALRSSINYFSNEYSDLYASNWCKIFFYYLVFIGIPIAFNEYSWFKDVTLGPSKEHFRFFMCNCKEGLISGIITSGIDRSTDGSLSIKWKYSVNSVKGYIALLQRKYNSNTSEYYSKSLNKVINISHPTNWILSSLVEHIYIPLYLCLGFGKFRFDLWGSLLSIPISQLFIEGTNIKDDINTQLLLNIPFICLKGLLNIMENNINISSQYPEIWIILAFNFLIDINRLFYLSYFQAIFQSYIQDYDQTYLILILRLNISIILLSTKFFKLLDKDDNISKILYNSIRSIYDIFTEFTHYLLRIFIDVLLDNKKEYYFVFELKDTSFDWINIVGNIQEQNISFNLNSSLDLVGINHITNFIDQSHTLTSILSQCEIILAIEKDTLSNNIAELYPCLEESIETRIFDYFFCLNMLISPKDNFLNTLRIEYERAQLDYINNEYLEYQNKWYKTAGKFYK